METKKSEPKKNTRFLVGKKDILSDVAKWAIFQSPFIPDKLEVMLSKIREKLENAPEFIKAEKDNLGFVEFDNRELRKWLHDLLMPIDEFKNLNLSLHEKNMGITLDNPNRPAFVGVSRFDKIKDEHAFVDLDALIMNVSGSIERNESHETI